MTRSTYKFKSKIIIYPGMGGWRFLFIPKKDSQKIKEVHGKNARGWGSIPVSVIVGKTTWETSIFPDKKSGTYLLPLKAKIRKAEEILDEDTVQFSLKIGHQELVSALGL